jgi:hypothetical protein
MRCVTFDLHPRADYVTPVKNDLWEKTTAERPIIHYLSDGRFVVSETESDYDGTVECMETQAWINVDICLLEIVTSYSVETTTCTVAACDLNGLEHMN